MSKVNYTVRIFMLFFICFVFLPQSIVYGAYDTYYEGALPDKPTKVNGIILVNKQNPLPKTYGSGQTDATTKAFNDMAEGAKKAGYTIQNFSGYRSYARQAELYQSYINKGDSKAKVDTYSARAGYSEHQTGLAMDISTGGTSSNPTSSAFKNDPGIKWLHENAHKYGFILRFNSTKTGYMEEFWHFRYIGKEHAKAYKESGVDTLEEYLGVKEGETINDVVTRKDAPSYEVYKKLKGESGDSDSEDGEEKEETESTKSENSTSNLEANYKWFDPFKKQNVAENQNMGVDKENLLIPTEVSYGITVLVGYVVKIFTWVMTLLMFLLIMLMSLQILSIVLINRNGGNEKLQNIVFGKSVPIDKYWSVLMLNAFTCCVLIAFTIGNFYYMLQVKIYLGIIEFIALFS